MSSLAIRVRAALIPAILAAALALACSDRDGGEATATPEPSETAVESPTPTGTSTPRPSATPTPTATPIPRLPDGVPLVTLASAEPGPIGRFAYVVETGCWECDGPATGLVRIHETSEGPIQDLLFGAPVNPREQLAGWAASPGLATMVVGVCSGAGCGPSGDPALPPQLTLYRSRDGGITWDLEATLDGILSVAAVSGEDVVLLRRGAGDGSVAIVRYPSGEDVTPPQGAGDARPFVLTSGAVVFTDESGVLRRSDGVALFEPPLEGALIAQVAAHPEAALLAVVWSGERAGERASFLTVLRTGGVVAHYELAEDVLIWRWRDERTLLANLTERGSGSTTPALVDVSEGAVWELEGPFGPGLGASAAGDLTGRNFLRAAAEGPFARVETGRGQCGAVRAEPEPAGELFGCYASGVLLGRSQAPPPAEAEWLEVTAPDGVAGWIAIADLAE